MKDFPETLAAFFLPEDGAQSGAEILDAAKLQDQLPDLPGDGLGDLGGAVVEALRSALDLPCQDLVVKAWGGLEELQEFAQPQAAAEVEDAGAEIVKPLASHSIQSSHSPRLKVLLGDTKICDIAIEVELTAELEGFVLHIKDGRIVEITTGSITAGGTLSVAGQTLVEATSEPYALPGRLVLDPPFPIARWK